MAGTDAGRDAERVLFLDTDGSIARLAAEALADAAGDSYDPTPAAVRPAGGEGDADADADGDTDADGPVAAAADANARDFTHVVTMTQAAKRDCPPVSPGTHYLHWPLDDLEGKDLRIAVEDRVGKAFGGRKTYTDVGDLPAAWSEAGDGGEAGKRGEAGRAGEAGAPEGTAEPGEPDGGEEGAAEG